MRTSETATEPVNPLTGDLTTIAVAKKAATGETTDVQGRLVAPGLAITPSLSTPANKPSRFKLTHVPTGLMVGRPWCGTHVQEIAEVAVAADVDWTAGQDQTVAAIKAVDGLSKQFSYWCDDWCEGDGPLPPVWLVRCNTCDWELDDHEGALTAEEAKRAAADHQCEPEIEIRHPETGKWHDEWLVDRDGAVRDLTPSSTRPNRSSS